MAGSAPQCVPILQVSQEATAWGTQEFQIRDPDGNRLRFGERQVAEDS